MKLKISFREYDFRIRAGGKSREVFDVVRKKFVALTPEEWVRQHWIHYLIEEMKYPRSLIASEMPMKLHKLRKRCDIIVHDRRGEPFLAVECKAPEVKLTQKALDQISRYNLTLRVKYLVISNGHESYCCEIDLEKKKFSFAGGLPPAEMIR